MVRFGWNIQLTIKKNPTLTKKFFEMKKEKPQIIETKFLATLSNSFLFIIP
jgi:hypothetical protein